MQEVMRCLQTELNDSPADIKAHRILQFMVQAKLAALEQGRNEQQVFSRQGLLLHVEGELKGQTLTPSTWLQAGLLERFLASREAALVTRLRQLGLEQMPIIRTNEGKGGKGIERSYWLDVEPLPDEGGDGKTTRPSTCIEYQRTQPGVVKPSWLIRQIFRDGELKNRSWRGAVLLSVILLGVAASAIWFFAGMWGVSDIDQALTLRQIGGTVFFGLCLWPIWTSFYRPWIRLVDHRVVKAPAALLSFWEDSAELEMHRDSEKHQWTRFVRFSGDCPLCSGQVLLMPGKPEQKVPLVGRCSESPYVHVYSFDRARLMGVYLGPREG